jgi:hypothetical protein
MGLVAKPYWVPKSCDGSSGFFFSSFNYSLNHNWSFMTESDLEGLG